MVELAGSDLLIYLGKIDLDSIKNTGRELTSPGTCAIRNSNFLTDILLIMEVLQNC